MEAVEVKEAPANTGGARWTGGGGGGRLMLQEHAGNGTDNTGGGAGGAGSEDWWNRWNRGSGIVIIRYKFQ